MVFSLRRPSGGKGGTYGPHAALIFVQFAYGGYHVLTKRALGSGKLDMFMFCAVRDVIALVCLTLYQAALSMQRKRKGLAASPLVVPPGRMLATCAFLGLIGVFLNQLLFIKGLELTTPTAAAALQPSIPVFTYTLAVILGNERLALHRSDGWAKLGGVAACVAGASITALLRGPVLLRGTLEGAAADAAAAAADSGGERQARGIGLLVCNCFCMATYLTVQEPLLQRFPAPSLITAWSYVFGVGALLAAAAMGAGDPASGGLQGAWSAMQPEARTAVVYAGVVASGLNYGLMAWANQHVGPATVSMYLPLQPLASSLLANAALGTPLHAGSVGGGALILLGLYGVTWGRAATRRVEGRLEDKAAYFTSLEADGNNPKRMIRSASQKLLGVTRSSSLEEMPGDE